MERLERQLRGMPASFETREEDGKKVIEGYFAVFNSNYEIGPGMSESIAPGAFSNSISGDIRALINHDTTLVLGRTKSHTLTLREDERGLWGHVEINPNDSDAVNLYERVSRGDVDGCSIGFEIVNEETDFRNDGSVHWTIRDVVLYEVSACTFPAYTETNISAREKQFGELKRRQLEVWKSETREKLKWH